MSTFSPIGTGRKRTLSISELTQQNLSIKHPCPTAYCRKLPSDQIFSPENMMEKDEAPDQTLSPIGENSPSFVGFFSKGRRGGSFNESTEKFSENEKGGRETLWADESMDCEDIPPTQQISSPTWRRLVTSTSSSDLSCGESIFTEDDENITSPRGSFIFDSPPCPNDDKPLMLFELRTETRYKINFNDLPDEIILAIFTQIPYTWKQLCALRGVSKLWRRLLSDASLKYGRYSKDLEIMMQNEKKHFSRIRDYFALGYFPDINKQMRGILVGWLGEVVEEFELHTETFFIAVGLMDRFLSLPDRQISRGKVQLLGVTALLIASKYEEIHAPTIKDLEFITDGAYSPSEITGMEVNVLNALQFDITVCTSLRFLHYYLQSMESFLKTLMDPAELPKVAHFADYVLESTLVPYEYVHYSPSFLSVAVVYLTLNNFQLRWCPELESETHYSFPQIAPLVKMIHQHLKSMPSEPLTSVYTKYSQDKFHSVAKLPIRDLPSMEN